MTPTLLAILSRFRGDRQQALDYCIETAMRYPHLRQEYAALANQLALLKHLTTAAGA